MTKLAYIVDRNNFGKVRFYGLVTLNLDKMGCLGVLQHGNNKQTYTQITFWRSFSKYTSNYLRVELIRMQIIIKGNL